MVIPTNSKYKELRDQAGELMATLDQSIDLFDTDLVHDGECSATWGEIASFSDMVKHLALAAHFAGAIDKDQVEEITRMSV